MTFTMLSNQQVAASVAAVEADGVTPSNAILSGVSFSSSDPTVATITPSTQYGNACLITGVAAGTCTLTAVATATEADGTSETISGSVTLTLTAPAPSNPAAALVWTFETPASIPPAPTASAAPARRAW